MFVVRVPPLTYRRTISSHKTGRVVSRYAPEAMCMVIKYEDKKAHFYKKVSEHDKEMPQSHKLQTNTGEVHPIGHNVKITETVS